MNCGGGGSSSSSSNEPISSEPPQKAINPTPPSDSLHISIVPQLQWEDGGMTDTYDIYLGKSEDAVSNADTLDSTFMANQSGTTYQPSTDLLHDQDYYWRIDSINENGVTKGDVWHFRTYNQNTVDAKNVRIQSIETIIGNGRGPKWSPDGQRIAFQRLHGVSPGVGSYEIFISNPDGTDEVNISESCPDLPSGRHKGAISWHPSGQWLLLDVEKDSYYRSDSPEVRALAISGAGLNTDLWLLAVDGSQAWRLTEVPTKMTLADSTPYSGILHPQFSHAGNKILYAYTQSPGTDVFGDWEMRIADFAPPPAAVAEHETAEIYEPGDKQHWYETHCWSSDDSKIYFSFSPHPGQDDLTTDIGVLDLTNDNYEDLTDSWQVEGTSWDGKSAWDEHAYLSPDSNFLGYISSKGYPMYLDTDEERKDWRDWLVTDVWWMAPTGADQERVSYFNDPTAPEYIGDDKVVVATGPSWNPDGSAFLCGLGIRHLDPDTKATLSWTYEIRVFWLDLNTNGVRDADEE
jgi:Tol biopolymer transport system component